jgi:hypothetical protein
MSEKSVIMDRDSLFKLIEESIVNTQLTEDDIKTMIKMVAPLTDLGINPIRVVAGGIEIEKFKVKLYSCSANIRELFVGEEE